MRLTAEAMKIWVISVALLATIGVLVGCSVVLLGVPAARAVVIAIAFAAVVGLVGVIRFTDWGRDQIELRAATKEAHVHGDASGLLRFRLERAQYGEARQTLETILPDDCVARKALADLVKQLDATRRSITLVGEKAGVDIGQQQLLNSANDFIVAKAGQAVDIHRHEYAGAATERALGEIAQQCHDLEQQLLLCQTELVAASGRDSWDQDRQHRSEREIRNVVTMARSLNRNPFEDLDEVGGVAR